MWRLLFCRGGAPRSITCRGNPVPSILHTLLMQQWSLCFSACTCHVFSNVFSSRVADMCSSKLLWELRQDAAACLGLLCTVLSYEAERIFKWLFLKFTSSSRDEVKLLYLVAAQRALEAAGERKAFSHVMQVTAYSWFLYSPRPQNSTNVRLGC